MATPHVPLFDLGCKITTKIRYAQTFMNVLRKKRNTRTNKGRHKAEERHAPIAYRPAHFLHVKEKQGYKTPLLPYKKALLPYKKALLPYKICVMCARHMSIYPCYCPNLLQDVSFGRTFPSNCDQNTEILRRRYVRQVRGKASE